MSGRVFGQRSSTLCNVVCDIKVRTLVRNTPSRDAAPPVAPSRQPAGTSDARRVAGLVLGDAVSFLVFASVGRASHSEASGLGALGQVATTAAPFALAWFAAAPFIGAYRRGATAAPRAMLGRTWLAWLAAWPVALLLRWVFTSKVPPLSFAIVALLANALFLSVWRGLFALVTSRRVTAASAVTRRP